MPHVADEGISQALFMLAPLRRLGIRAHTVSHEEPVDELICSHGPMFGDEVVDMRWTAIDDPSAPTTLDADFVHEGIVAGPMFHQHRIPAPSNISKASLRQAY